MAEIKLNSRHYKILKAFSKKVILREDVYIKYQTNPHYSLPFKQLEENNYIFEYMRIDDDEYVYSITTDGSNEYQLYADERIKYWIPIIISNLIATAALIVAILALLKK